MQGVLEDLGHAAWTWKARTEAEQVWTPLTHKFACSDWFSFMYGNSPSAVGRNGIAWDHVTPYYSHSKPIAERLLEQIFIVE